MRILKRIKRSLVCTPASRSCERLGFKRKSSNLHGTNNLPRISFHPIHGENIRLSSDGTSAKRIDSFCKGIVFSSRPIREKERIYIKLGTFNYNWSGTLRFGFTTINPSTFKSCSNVPKYVAPDMSSKPGTRAVAVPERYLASGNILCMYYTGDTVYYSFNGEKKKSFKLGDKFFNNSPSASLPNNVKNEKNLKNIQQGIWALFDIYGSATSIDLLDARVNNLLVDSSTINNPLYASQYIPRHLESSGKEQQSSMSGNLRPRSRSVSSSHELVHCRSVNQLPDRRAVGTFIDGDDEDIENVPRVINNSHSIGVLVDINASDDECTSDEDEDEEGQYQMLSARRANEQLYQALHNSRRNPLQLTQQLQQQQQQQHQQQQQSLQSVNHSVVTLNKREPLPSVYSNVPLEAINFHRLRGCNVSLSNDRCVAERNENHYSQGYVFAGRNLKINEKLIIQVLTTDQFYSGSLTFGLTVCPPDSLSPYDLPDDANQLLDRPEYWIVAKNVANNPSAGDELSFEITSNGLVLMTKNRLAPVVLFHVDPTQKFYPFFDLYGSTSKIRLLGTLDGIKVTSNRNAPGNCLANGIRMTGRSSSAVNTSSNTCSSSTSSSTTATATVNGTSNHRTGSNNTSAPTDSSFSHSIASPVNHNSTGYPLSGRNSVGSIVPTATSSLCNPPLASISRDLYAALVYNSQVNFTTGSSNNSRCTVNATGNLQQHQHQQQQQQHQQQQQQQKIQRRMAQQQPQQIYQRIPLQQTPNQMLLQRQIQQQRPIEQQQQQRLYSTVRSVKQSANNRPFMTEYASVKSSKSSHNLAHPSSNSYIQLRHSSHHQQQQKSQQQQQQQQHKPQQHSPCYSAISRGSSAQSTGSLDSISNECTVCYEAPINTVLYMCGHMCMCYECAIKQWRAPGGGQCPICRAHIKDIIRTYRS